MQDKYAGDVGDFGKFALLRTVAAGESLGVGWYFTQGVGESNGDGRHTAYLDDPARFLHLDPCVFWRFRRLRTQVARDPRLRKVSTLEKLALLPDGTRFHGEPCPRAAADRPAWCASMLEALRGSTFTFVDPDNGISADEASHKHASIGELQALARLGPVLAYHHQTRMRGGAASEYQGLRGRLLAAGFSDVCAARLKPYSSRFYFLLNGTTEHRRRLESFCAIWKEKAAWFD